MLIGEIAALLLEKRLGAKVERRMSLGGTSTLFQALQNGDVHFYLEYARHGFQTFFQAIDPIDPAMSTQKLRELFRRNANSEWLPPLGFESNHLLLTSAGHARLSGLQSVSEAAADKDGWRLGFSSEFSQSPEGYVSFKNAYQIAERTAPRIEPLGQLYAGLKEGRIDLLVTTTTDPLARSLEYKALTDDKRAFAGNRASFLLNGPKADDNPDFAATLKLLSGRFSGEEMVRLNGEVLVKNRAIVEVAREWLERSGLAGAPAK
jgi:glycine betaine/choline ABC-type transport system substrate-binding protein